MKYIKTYEAFESEILSSTLEFVKDKNGFIEIIKKICNKYNFPISNLSDYFFEYLPFNKALKKTDSLGSLPCDAESIDVFGDFGIEGEKCKGGNIKRKWGKSVRNVKCPKCNGSGISKKDNTITLFKFWFSSDGIYIGTTCFNNNISDIELSSFSRNINDYEQIEKISDINKLETGNIVLIETERHPMPEVAYIIKEGDRVFAIQDNSNGGTPNTDFKHIAQFSWVLGPSYTYSIILLKSKIIKNDIDPFSYNLIYNLRYDRPETSRCDVRSFLKNANFAIILDIDKLKKSTYKDVNITKKERSDARSGSYALLSNEDIKKINLYKYIEILSNKMDIYVNQSNCNKLVSRILNRDYLIFEFKHLNITDYFERIISLYYNILNEPDDYYKKRNIDNLNVFIKDMYKKSRDFSIIIDRNILNYKIRLQEVEKTEYFKLIEKIIEINRAFYDKIVSINVETIDDFEIVLSKIRIFRGLFNNDRIFNSYLYSYFMDYIYNSIFDRAIYRLDDLNIEEQVKKLERIIKMIDKI